jgi:hypothetical protein
LLMGFQGAPEMSARAMKMAATKPQEITRKLIIQWRCLGGTG